MSTPAEQFAAEHDQALADIAKLKEWQSECQCGTVDIDPPTPEPEPTPPPGDKFAGVPQELLDLPLNYRDKEGREYARHGKGWLVQDGLGGIVYDFRKVLLHDGRWTGDGSHDGMGIYKCDEVYVIDAILDGLQHFYQANGANTRTIMRNVIMRNVREDAIRNVEGLIEDVTIESADMISGGHGDTIDLKNPVDGLTVRNLRSVSGRLNGIITADVKNLVIDGYEHLGEPNHLSIDIGGKAENVTIRNCKLSGGIRFRGEKKNVVVDWGTVQTNVPREEFK